MLSRIFSPLPGWGWMSVYKLRLLDNPPQLKSNPSPPLAAKCPSVVASSREFRPFFGMLGIRSLAGPLSLTMREAARYSTARSSAWLRVDCALPSTSPRRVTRT